MSVRVLIFDLWGTLIGDSAPLPQKRFRTRLGRASNALTAAGCSFPEEAVGAALQSSGEAHGALHARGEDISAPERTALFLDHLDSGLAHRLPAATLRAVEDALASAVLVHPPAAKPGALGALREAERRGLALGLISNTGLSPGYVLREILAAHELLPYLRVLTFSDEARLAKPAEAIFHCTLDALGAKPSEAVFIGDMPALDVAGPLAVGMWAVQVGDQRLDGVRPHDRIDSLEKLFPSLARLGLLD